MNSQSGASYIELLVGMAIVALVATISVGTVTGLKQQVKQNREKLQSRANISMMLESISENMGEYVRVFRLLSDSDRERLLNYNTATLHFDERGIFPKAKCPECIGRISYLIEPHPALPGFNMVTMKIFDTPEESVQYRFITGEI